LAVLAVCRPFLPLRPFGGCPFNGTFSGAFSRPFRLQKAFETAPRGVSRLSGRRFGAVLGVLLYGYKIR
jgi:hypothetical protein